MTNQLGSLNNGNDNEGQQLTLGPSLSVDEPVVPHLH